MSRLSWKALLIIAAAVSVSASIILHRVFPPPRLVCETTKFDLGTIAPGNRGEHSFLLRNSGGRPLKIDSVLSSCTCTSAVVSEEMIPAGHTATLKVVLRIPENATRAVARIVVNSNDPVSPATEFLLNADPNPVFAVSPSGIDIGRVEYGRAAGRVGELMILCADPDALDLQLDDWSRPSCVHAQIIQSSSRPSLRVSIDDSIPIGPLTATVRLREKSGLRRELNLSVRGEVVGAYRANPEQVYLNASGAARSDKTSVEIIPLGPTSSLEAIIEAVSPDLSPFIDANVRREQGRVLIEFAIRQTHTEHATAPVRGFVTIRPHNSKKELIKIPVQVTFGAFG
jgi:hypothetical protein